MEVFGVALMTVALFVGFGALVGVLFGFFGMGGSFLITPALLTLGYPTRVAVGSGLAFVFGTSVIGALRHRDLGQVDYKLAGLLTVGVTVGIEGGKRLVLALEAMGFADTVVSVAYILLLAGVGAFVLIDARRGGDDDCRTNDGRETGLLEQFGVPPTVSLTGGPVVSVWAILALGLAIGVLAGVLGVGGGFLLMPAMLYGLGVPAAVAVGTDILQITVSGAFGAFRYAQLGGVDLSIVVPLLAGSALGAQFGTAATRLVDDDDLTGAFGTMLLLGALAVALRTVGGWTGITVLQTVSFLVIVAAALLVTGAIAVAAIGALRTGNVPAESSAD